LPWVKLSWHRDPKQALGLSSAGNASVALDELEGAWRVVGVRDLGATTVGGVPTTRYEVSTSPVCTPAHHSTLVDAPGPSFVWVDAHGRMVQITGSVRIGGHLPVALQQEISSPWPAYPVITTDTLRLTAFGAPVRIHAPSHLRTPYASSGSATLRLDCSK